MIYREVQYNTTHHIRTPTGPPVTCRPVIQLLTRLLKILLSFFLVPRMFRVLGGSPLDTLKSRAYLTAKARTGTTPTTFIHWDLKNLTHVFLQQDAIRRALDPPYNGPHKFIARIDKTFKIVVRGRRPSCQQTESSLRTF